MIKNLKYCLLDVLFSKRVRMGVIAIMLAFSVVAVTLLGSPIHAEEILAGHRGLPLNKMLMYGGMAEVKNEAAYPVYITQGDNTVTIDFTSGTVADALAKAGITPDSDDYVEPSMDTVITDTVYIDYTAVQYVTGSYKETVKYSTETVYTDKKAKGYTQLIKKGVNGEKVITYTQKIVNGVATEKIIEGEEVTAEPQNEQVMVGTKEKTSVTAAKTNKAVKTSADVKDISTLTPKKEIKLDSKGNPVSYKKKMTVRATAYTYTGNKCATGVTPQPGYIAVNPKVIPYGTKMYIKSPDGSVIYGYAVAADTGGFIRRYPTGVDLFMSTRSACTNFGVRNMEIYILD